MPTLGILLTGTMGVGKTSVLLELGEQLAARPDPYAIVDLDWLAWLRPAAGSAASVQAVLATNLGHVARTFAAAGVERIALARAVDSHAEVDSIRAALAVDRLTVVRLVAARDVIVERLEGRDTGAQLAEHLAEAEGFAARAERASIGDVVIDTDRQAVESVARQVLEAAGWS